jgi:hypothetical protein
VSRRALLLAALVASPIVASAQNDRMDGRAQEILQEMSRLLSEATGYAFRTEQTVDDVLDSGLKAQFASSQALALSKPNRVVGHSDGDLLTAGFWYDGETATFLDERHFRYVQIEMSGSLDADLDSLADDYDMTLPLADFVSENVYAELVGPAEYMTYLGIHRVGARRCHHVALANAWLEWQVWVDAENEALPCKLVINYMDEPGEPQFSAVFHSWNLNPELSEELFRFEPPEGAERMEPRSLGTILESGSSEANP